MPVFNNKMSKKNNNKRGSTTNKPFGRTNIATSSPGSPSPSTGGAAASPIQSMIRRIELENGSGTADYAGNTSCC